MREKIMEILTGLRPECDFENSDNYIEDGLLDSMDIVALVDSVEEEYGISIPGTAISAKYFGNLDSIVPGIAPLITRIPLSPSTMTTLRFCTVQLTAPICPGIFLPGTTLPGVEVAPIEPTLL